MCRLVHTDRTSILAACRSIQHNIWQIVAVQFTLTKEENEHTETQVASGSAKNALPNSRDAQTKTLIKDENYNVDVCSCFRLNETKDNFTKDDHKIHFHIVTTPNTHKPLCALEDTLQELETLQSC